MKFCKNCKWHNSCACHGLCGCFLSCMCIHLFVQCVLYPSVCLSVRLSVRLAVFLRRSVCASMCLPVCTKRHCSQEVEVACCWRAGVMLLQERDSVIEKLRSSMQELSLKCEAATAQAQAAQPYERRYRDLQACLLQYRTFTLHLTAY